MSDCKNVCNHILNDLIHPDDRKASIVENITKTVSFSPEQCARHCMHYWEQGTMHCIENAQDMKHANKCLKRHDDINRVMKQKKTDL